MANVVLNALVLLQDKIRLQPLCIRRPGVHLDEYQ